MTADKSAFALGIYRARARFHSPDGLHGWMCGLCAEYDRRCWLGDVVAEHLAELEAAAKAAA